MQQERNNFESQQLFPFSVTIKSLSWQEYRIVVDSATAKSVISFGKRKRINWQALTILGVFAAVLVLFVLYAGGNPWAVVLSSLFVLLAVGALFANHLVKMRYYRKLWLRNREETSVYTFFEDRLECRSRRGQSILFYHNLRRVAVSQDLLLFTANTNLVYYMLTKDLTTTETSQLEAFLEWISPQFTPADFWRSAPLLAGSNTSSPPPCFTPVVTEPRVLFCTGLAPSALLGLWEYYVFLPFAGLLLVAAFAALWLVGRDGGFFHLLAIYFSKMNCAFIASCVLAFMLLILYVVHANRKQRPLSTEFALTDAGLFYASNGWVMVYPKEEIEVYAGHRLRLVVSDSSYKDTVVSLPWKKVENRDQVKKILNQWKLVQKERP